MWTLARLLIIACQLSCYATASSEPVHNQEEASCHAPKVSADERTSLLQASSVIQKRGTPAESPPTAAPMDTKGDVNAAKGAVVGYADGVNAGIKAGVETAAIAAAPRHSPYVKETPPEPGVVSFGQIMTVIAYVIIGLFMACGKCMPRRSPMTADGIEKMRRSWTVRLLSLSYCTVQMITTDQYLPSLAKMQIDLDTTALNMSVTLQVNWLLKGLSALSMAALSNHFGRKPLLLLFAVSIHRAPAGHEVSAFL
jgi:hypothetical protein